MHSPKTMTAVQLRDLLDAVIATEGPDIPVVIRHDLHMWAVDSATTPRGNQNGEVQIFTGPTITSR